jgi:hypothetical protein
MVNPSSATTTRIAKGIHASATITRIAKGIQASAVESTTR